MNVALTEFEFFLPKLREGRTEGERTSRSHAALAVPGKVSLTLS